MMINLILTILAISIDGFFSGLILGLKKIKISLLALFYISLGPFIISLPIMILGSSLKSFIPSAINSFLSFIIFLLLALLSLKETINKKSKTDDHSIIKVINNPELADLDHNKKISFIEGIFLGIVLSIDNGVAAFGISIQNYNPIIISAIIGIAHFILIGLGNYIAKFKYIIKITNKFKYIPAILFLILAITRLL